MLLLFAVISSRQHASQAYCLMLMNVDADAQASLKMKSDRFEKASEEIGVPRGKKTERYRSTAHGRTDRRQFIAPQSLRYYQR